MTNPDYTNNSNRIYWVDLNRFDTKTDKSTWLEVSDVLVQFGYNVTILAGYEIKKNQPKNTGISIKYFETLNVFNLFRYSLMFGILYWLIKNGGRRDVYILPPGGLYIAPFLSLLGRSNIHLDIRTVPVDVHTTKDKLNVLLFWKLPIRYLRRYATGFSFITHRLRMQVEKEFRTKFDDYVIWHSGVNTNLFTPIKQRGTDARSDVFIIFYHGTITQNRGIRTLVEAVGRLSGIYKEKTILRLIGKGSDFEYIRQYVAQCKLSNYVDVVEYVPYEDIPCEINKADCCICPLPDLPEWNVSSPIKIFEYMACGKPIILTPIPAHKDVAGDCDFVVWSDGDSVPDLVDAMQRAYDMREQLTNAAAIRAIERVRDRYTWDIQGSVLASYIEKKSSMHEDR